MDRSEDLKQVRDLHLVRDERDREVEAAAGLRAGNAVVLVSQLLSAVCLLQDDPAWMALLSLTLVWGGVKGFWQIQTGPGEALFGVGPADLRRSGGAAGTLFSTGPGLPGCCSPDCWATQCCARC